MLLNLQNVYVLEYDDSILSFHPTSPRFRPKLPAHVLCHSVETVSEKTDKFNFVKNNKMLYGYVWPSPFAQNDQSMHVVIWIQKLLIFNTKSYKHEGKVRFIKGKR